MSERPHRLHRLAWALGFAGALACAASAASASALGAPGPFLFVYVVAILMGLLGGLIAAREPHNSIGWLMSATAIAASLMHLAVGYGYLALLRQHNSWPLGPAAIWLGAWVWALVLISLPLMTLRFPDGTAKQTWRFVDWLAFAGAAVLAVGIAVQPAGTLIEFLPISSSKITALLTTNLHSSIGVPVAQRVFNQALAIGLTLIIAAYIGAAGSLVGRFRHAHGDDRLQLKWLAYSGALIAAAFVLGLLAWTFLGQPLYAALIPVDVAALTLPAAIGVAILRYRLYEIDLIINRTLVYGSLTALLGAFYVASITFLQRSFISLAGQKSDAAYVLIAFLVVVVAGPTKDWLQRRVDRRLGGATASSAMEKFSAEVESVISVIDFERLGRRLVDQVVVAYDARGAALYLPSGAHEKLFYHRGEIQGRSTIEVGLSHEGTAVGRLLLGGRRGDAAYSKHDRIALQRSAESVANALMLAARLGERQLAADRLQQGSDRSAGVQLAL